MGCPRGWMWEEMRKCVLVGYGLIMVRDFDDILVTLGKYV